MQTTVTQQADSDVAERFAHLDNRLSASEYNFANFRAQQLLSDLKRTIAGGTIEPGEIAPDFELARVGGDSVRLSSLRGRPLLLHFGSFT